MYVVFLVVALTVIFLRCGVPIDGTRIITATDCPVPRDIFNTLGSIMACLNSLCDWTFAFVPLHMVISASRMDMTSKMSAGVLIVLAVSSSFISLARVPFFARGDSFEPNTIYNTVHIFLLSVVENAVGIAVISVATLKPLLGAVRNGSLARRPSLAPILPQHRKARKVKGGAVPARVRIEQHEPDTFDWQALRGIGILPNAGTEISVQFVDDKEDGYSMPKKPSRVVLQVTRMASIDEVMHSLSDASTTQTIQVVSTDTDNSQKRLSNS